jgi:hypothetical protein
MTRRGALGLAVVLAWLAWALIPLEAHAAAAPVEFAISWVHPGTAHLTPLVVFRAGAYRLRREMRFAPFSKLYVKVRAPQGRYLSAAFRDDSTRIYDLPLTKRLMTSDTKAFYWTMPSRFMPGKVEFFLCLWQGCNEDNGYMEGTLFKSDFVTLGQMTL